MRHSRLAWIALLAATVGLPGSLSAQGTVPDSVQGQAGILPSTGLQTDPFVDEPVAPDPLADIWSASAAVPLGPTIPSSGQQPDPAVRFWHENHPDLTNELHEQVLNLEPSADNRRAIERVREVAKQTEVGVDTSSEEWIETKGQPLSLRWGGRIHSDWATWADDSQFTGGQSDYIEFRRLRLMAAGEGYGVYFYQLELEFAPEGRLAPQTDIQTDTSGLVSGGVELKDAYLGMRDVAGLGTVKVGHYFTPIGLDGQTSSNSLTFLERSFASRFLPGREYGLSASNHTVEQDITWSYGIFAYEMRENLRAIENDNQGYRLIGRVTATPFYDQASEGRSMMHTGLGYAFSRPRVVDDPLRPTEGIRPVEFNARAEIHRGETLISTGTLDTASFHTTATELAWVHGPLSLQNEFIWTSLDDTTLGMMNFYGTYTQASYFLTGEHRPYDRRQGVFDRLVPLENAWFVPTPRGTSAGWGAWEVAARWSYMDLSAVNDQQLNDITVGMNWYLNPHSRLMFNWVHPIALNSVVSDLETAEGDALSARFQVDF